MPTINKQQLIDLIKQKGSATFVTLTAVTTPRLQKGSPFEDLSKVCKANCQIRYNYEKAVNNARIRRDAKHNFRAQRRQWGYKIPGTALVTLRKEPHSLDVRVLKVLEVKYFDRGLYVPEQEVTPFLSSSIPTEGVKVRSYGLNSIRSLVLNSEEFFIKD